MKLIVNIGSLGQFGDIQNEKVFVSIWTHRQSTIYYIHSVCKI